MLLEDHALAPDSDVPASTDLTFLLAADDVMYFSSAGIGVTSDVATLVERETLAAGIEKHAGKDVADSIRYYSRGDRTRQWHLVVPHGAENAGGVACRHVDL